MASTPLLGLSLPADGTTNWGTLVNTSITALLDSAVAGTTTLTVDGDATLSDTQEVTNEARQAIILWKPSSGTVTRTITAPAKSKTYVVINATGGTQSIIFRGSGSPPTTGVTIPAGKAYMLAWNGLDFVIAGDVYGQATVSVDGLIKLGDATVQSVAANAVTATASRTYALQLNSGGQAVVNVPWTDTSSTPPAGANTQIQFNNSGSFGGSADFIFNGSQVGILNASPAATLDVGGNSIIGSTTAGAGITIFRRATIPTSGSTFGNITFASTVDGTTLQIGGSILARASEAWTGSGTGTRLVFRTATNGFVGPSDKMTLENNGDLAVTGAISAAARLVSGVGSVASAATITPTSDTVNQYNVTALATPATIAAPSGTPVDGQKLIIRIKDDGTARALTWNAIYRTIGTILPTTTVATKTTYVGCIYNSADAVWDVVSVTTQA